MSISGDYNGKLNLASEAYAEVKGKGDVMLSIASGEGGREIEFKNTLFVPNLRTNLVSIAKITDKGHSVTFFKTGAHVCDEKGNIMIIADRRNDLFVIREYNDCAVAQLKDTDLMKWHYRLGHLNLKDINKLINFKILPQIDMTITDDVTKCVVCAKGKMTATPFGNDHEKCTEILKNVHSDVVGPFRIESLQKEKYFVTFIDECTRWCQIYFLREKGDVLKAFKIYHKFVENQCNNRIKFLQSDNGREYLNGDFDEYLNQHGIGRRNTIPRTPQQNGIAERFNRTIMDMTRCLLLQANLSDQLWAVAVSAACYIRNRCPSSILNGATPYEKWFKKKPNLNHLRVFGAKVMVLDKEPNKSKLVPKSCEGVFVGYPYNRKGYRIWLPVRRQIVESRDVKFIDEHINLPEKLHKPNGDIFSTNTFTIDEDQNNAIEFLTLTNPIKDAQRVPEPKRGRGRPKLVRTGARGRPRRLFSTRGTEGDAENMAIRPESEIDDVGAEIEMNTNTAAVTNNNPESEIDDVGADIEMNTNTAEVTNNNAESENDNVEARNNNLLNDAKHDYAEDDVFADAHAEFACVAEVKLNDALNGSDADDWYDAIEDEIASIFKHSTWDIVKTPVKSNIVGCRFVLTNKFGHNGKIERRKARLVAKGYNQQHGINYNYTFAPVARLETIRLLLALSAHFSFIVWQFDIVTAYLNGALEEKVLMKIPDMLSVILKRIVLKENYNAEVTSKANKILQNLSDGGNCCLLKKSLYGLKQAGRQWYSRLRIKLESMGLKSTKNEPCLFSKNIDGDMLIIVVYVDDLLVASPKQQHIHEVKIQLLQDFEIKDIGLARYCLGLEITQNKSHIFLKQKCYIENLLKAYGMVACNVVTTPAETNMHSIFLANDLYDGPSYRELIGALMYLSVASRLDNANVVSRLAQFVNTKLQGHWQAAKRVLRYLAGTSDKGLMFTKNNIPLQAYTDSDWGGCVTDRRSYTGYVFLFSGGAITWKAQKQRTVSLSSTEVEYISLAEAAKEAIYLKSLFAELGLQRLADIVIYVDNKGAECLANDPIMHSRTKHIDIRFHFIREAITNKVFTLKHISTQEMVADVLTKPLPKVSHNKCLEGLGMQIERAC